MKHFFTAIAALALLANSSLEAQAALELVVNGSFEDNLLAGPGHVHVDNGTGPGNSVIPGWGVGLAIPSGPPSFPGVDLVQAPAYGLDPAADGIQFVDLNGTPGPGNIFQVLSTVAGQLYELTFAHASNNTNSVGLFGVWDGIDASGAAIIALTPFADGPTSPLDWQYVTAQFTALSDNTTIAFGSFLPPSGNAGAMVDAVSVQAVPEPMTVIVWGTLGLCGSAVAWRVKKKQLTA